MATQYVGDAAFKYATVGATSTTTTVSLAVPLYNLHPGEARTRFVTESVDFTNREVITIGSAVDTLSGMIRAHNDAAELMDMISAGLDGKKLRYFPSASATSVNYHFRLTDTSEISPDPDRAGKDEYQVTFHFRNWSSTAPAIDPLVRRGT